MSLKTNRFKSLPIEHSKDIGLWFEGSDAKPFLYIGITLAIFQVSGKIDSSSDLLNSMVRGFETAF